MRAVGSAFLALIISVRGAVAAAETVDYRTSDGVEIVADLLVPPEYHQAMVLFHRDGDDASELAALPAALEAEGFAVLVPDRRGHGRSGAPERPIRQSDNAAWLRDGPAAVAFLHERFGADVTVGFVGLGSGAELAARTAANTAGTGALVLFDPDEALTGLASLQPGTGTSRPCLILAGREDARTREAARALFLLRPRHAQLWLLDGNARIGDVLLGRADFAGDLASWIARGGVEQGDR